MIQIGKRKVKPKVYNILILTLVMFFLLGFYILMDGTASMRIVCGMFIVYFSIVFILLVRAFIHQLEYNLYSYNVIYYAGFSAFTLFVLISNIVVTLPTLLEQNTMTLISLMYVLMQSARMYLILSAPFILVFSVALCISNISLIHHEGLRFKNLLGILLAFCLIAGWIIIYRLEYWIPSVPIRQRTLIVNVLASVYLYFECLLIGTVIAGVIAAFYVPDRDRDFMVVLGCGIGSDGSPSPLLMGRLNKALEFYKRQKEETGKELIFVTSGGQGSDEVISESESMKRYLMEQGIPEEQIIKEDRSTDTYENMKFSRDKIMEVNPEGKTAFSTTNYHVFRSGGLARKVKLYAYGVGADTKWYFWPNGAVRELIGLLAERPVRQVIILSGIIALFSALTLIVHRV